MTRKGVPRNYRLGEFEWRKSGARRNGNDDDDDRNNDNDKIDIRMYRIHSASFGQKMIAKQSVEPLPRLVQFLDLYKQCWTSMTIVYLPSHASPAEAESVCFGIGENLGNGVQSKEKSKGKERCSRGGGDSTLK